MLQSDSFKIAIIDLMLKESQNQNLPKFYKEDLEIDKDQIMEGNSDQYIWCLREAGTQIFPVGIGAIPEIIEFYAVGGGISQSNKFYLIDMKKISIQEISANEVERYSRKVPDLNSNTIESVIENINEVLSNGVNLKLWGVFSYPVSVNQHTYSEWLNEFKYLKNKPMQMFMEKAIAYLNKFNKLAL